MNLYIVGQIINAEQNAWEFQGVFSTEEAAVEACVNEKYFVAPATLDATITHQPIPWIGAYYPLTK